MCRLTNFSHTNRFQLKILVKITSVGFLSLPRAIPSSFFCFSFSMTANFHCGKFTPLNLVKSRLPSEFSVILVFNCVGVSWAHNLLSLINKHLIADNKLYFTHQVLSYKHMYSNIMYQYDSLFYTRL